MSCEKPSDCGSASICGSVTYIASILVLVIFIINAGFILANRSLQNDVIALQTDFSTKSGKISQNGTLANINQSLIQALTTAAITKRDEQIKALLVENKVDLTPKAPAK
ncbi:MAG: hypothetical protein EB059_08590 [Alphaproteobacteria bacterium]|nr:hypothetical protein [Alphaproteobacteria bacterium]